MISLTTHRWFRIYRGFEIDPDEVGEIEGANEGMLSVYWPAHDKTVWVPASVISRSLE